MQRLSVDSIETIWLNLPLQARAGLHHCQQGEGLGRELRTLRRVTLSNGVVGVGEGSSDSASIRRITGEDASKYLWDDSIGLGLQMALLDAVGKSQGVPVHRLMGDKCRDRVALSWWAGAMPAEDWRVECQEALSNGYRSFKAKARPWFDLREQCRLLDSSLPEDFSVGLDFNCLLVDSAIAEPHLVDLERYRTVGVYETPIPQGDIPGYRALRSKTKIPVAIHYGSPPIELALENDVCDGFVIGGGVGEILESAAKAAEADKPFWIQMVGSEITATFCLHLASVLSHARWPCVNLHHLFAAALIRPRIEVTDGTATVPDRPGLGVDLDEDAIERYRIDSPPLEPPRPASLLLAVEWPEGGTSYYGNGRMMLHDFMKGHLPAFARGVSMREIPNDGSRDWKDLLDRALKSPVHVGKVPLQNSGRS